MSGDTPESFVIIRFPLAVLLCSAAPVALSVDFSCGAGPNVNHSVDATPFTVYQIEGQNILLVPAGTVSKFVAWQSRAQNSNTTTDISPGTGTKFQYEVFSLRILSMTSDLNGTQFRYITSESIFGKVIFISNWTTTIIGHPPTVTGIPNEKTIIEGKIGTITFINSGTPRPSVTCWNESSGELVDRARFNCSSGYLVIGPLFESDEAQYAVKSMNCFGSQTAQMKLVVIRGPTIHSNIANRSVECGSDVTMSYSIDGDPTPDFQWYFEGSPYYPAFQPTSFQPMIRSVIFKNTGLYSLKVNNSAGEKSVFFTLSLKKETLRFTLQPSLSVSGQTDCMQPFNVTCTAVGPSVQSIYWSGDVESSHSEYVSRIDDCGEQEIVSTLTIKGYSETGRYRFTCHATNSSPQPVTSDDTFVQVWCQSDAPTVRVFSKTNNSVTLSMSQPGYTGDFTITNYSVVYRNVTVPLHPFNDSILVPIKDLTSNTIYKFEVTVHSYHGASEIASVTVRTDGIPGQILIQPYLRFGSTEIQCKSVNLQLPLPDNGGTDINAYSVTLTDIRRGNTTDREFLSVSNNNSRIYVDHLNENTAYTLQVRGRNKYGLGPSSDTLLFQTASCEEVTRLTAAVGVLASLLCLTILVAVYLGYRLRLVRASKATEMKEATEARVDAAAPYATVVESRGGHHQSETLTSSPVYEAATVQVNPAYGVVKNDPTGKR